MGKPSRAQQRARTNRHNRTRRTFTSEWEEGTEPVQNPLEGVAFTIDGVEFACAGQVTLLDYSELAAMAMQGADVRSPAGIAMISSFLSLAMGPVEYMRLRAHVREHNTPPSVQFDMVTEISDALQDYAEQETGRPTKPSSPSPDGPQDRDERIARVISLERGDVKIVPADQIETETTTG